MQNSEQNGKAQESFLEGLSSTCGVVAVAMFVFVFLFQNFFIPSSSMASTLLVGDHVMVDRETFAPATRWAPFVHYRDVRRGDIVVFYKPAEEADGQHMILVKRVIGIPGDHIHLRDGVVCLNGKAQTEPEAAKPTPSTFDAYADDFPSVPAAGMPAVTAEWAESLPSYVHNGDLVVPPGQYFVMGDNRDNSLDSRFWGFVPRADILGRPLFVYWSIAVPESDSETVPLSEQVRSSFSELTHFFAETRWLRTFHRIQ